MVCFLNFTSIKNSPHLFVLPSHPNTQPHVPRQISNIYHTVWRHFLLPIHTNTYPVLSAVLLQLFAPHNHLQLCGRKHFTSAMETQYVRQSTVHQHLHYSHQQHCFLSYVILLHVKIISDWFFGVVANLQKASISFAMSVGPSFLPPTLQTQWKNFYKIWVY